MKYVYKSTEILVESDIPLDTTNFSEFTPKARNAEKPNEEKAEAPKRKVTKTTRATRKG
jgi:hypothetical protein